jgi:hypothetical protein
VNTQTAEFKWGTAPNFRIADYTFVEENKSVFIWTDMLKTTGQALNWSAAAAADPLDIWTAIPAPRLLPKRPPTGS